MGKISDIDYCNKIIRDFFSLKSVSRKFEFLGNNLITSYEKWLQIELSHFMDKQYNLSYLILEDEFKVRKDSFTDKTKVRPDIGFRPKGWKKESLIYIELKQNLDYKKCLKEMIKDFEKVDASLKWSKNRNNIRYIYLCGVFKNTENLKGSFFKEYIENNSVIDLSDGYLFKSIPNTQYSVFAF